MDLNIFSFPEVVNLIESGEIKKFTHCISIGDPKSNQPKGLEIFLDKLLRLEFFDMDEALSRIEGLPDFRDLPSNAPTPYIVKLILEFSENLIHDENCNLLIHCQMGVSRSTATGLILLYQKYKNEELALKILNEKTNKPLPNTYLIGYADQILNSNLYKIIPRMFG